MCNLLSELVLVFRFLSSPNEWQYTLAGGPKTDGRVSERTRCAQSYALMRGVRDVRHPIRLRMSSDDLTQLDAIWQSSRSGLGKQE